MDTDTRSQGTITVRYATADDATVLLDLGISTFYDTFAAVNTKDDMDLYLAKNFSQGQIAQELADMDNTFFVAESNGQPAGYAKLRRGTTPAELEGIHAIELERLYAAKAFIGRQVGKTLMNACLDAAKEEKFSTVWLGVWEHNTRAIAFYTKCGFEKFSEHPFVLGTDKQTDHMMKKEI